MLLWAWMVMVPLVAALVHWRARSFFQRDAVSPKELVERADGKVLVVELVRQSWDMVFFSAVLLWCCLEAFSFGVECFREEIGRPRITDGSATTPVKSRS